MKSLTLSQPLVIMIVGLPGAGKSFFARQFSETFGAPVVSQDRIRYELFSQPQFNADETDIVNRMTLYQLEELLKTKRTLLYDANANSRVNRSRIEQLAKKAGYSTLVIWVQTDPATCKMRAFKRTKRAEDQYNVSLAPEQFDKFAKALTPPLRENFVVISGKHTYPTQARVVLKKLVGPREEQVERAHRQQEPTQRPVQPPQPSEPKRRSVPIN